MAIDLLVRAGRAVAVEGDRIVAVTADPYGLDDRIGPGTRVVNGAAVLPAFDDTHTHLVHAGHAAHDVPVHRARDIPEFLALIRERAAATPEGDWIRTTTNWQELNLAERRMPTAAELDRATDRHPVLVKRGGHNAVANTCALRLGGVTADTPEPPGGIIGRTEDGAPNGRLIDAAMHLVERLYPAADEDARVDGLDAASHAYAATGIGTVRDCAVPLADLDVLRRTADAGRLGTRVRALVIAQGAAGDPARLDGILDAMEPWRDRADPWLRVWGVKFLLDGGLEAGATEEPYAGRPDYRGLLLWEPDALADAVERVVRRGWRAGTHAFGDRAVRVLLDVYERVLARNPGLPPRSLVIEHAGLAPAAQRARAVALGVPVTVQQPLLHDTAEVAATHWGAERVGRLFPVRGWIDDGALVTAGSDFPVGPYGAMRSVWGLTTRQTVAGVRGPEHAVTTEEAIALHTTAAARFLGEDDRRGALAPGLLADLTVWPADPYALPPEELRDLAPLLTVVGGRVTHDGTGPGGG